MATQLTRDIPNFGTATLRIPGFGLVMHLRQATDEVEEPKRAALFTNRLLAAMLVEPRMAPEEIQNLPTDSVTNLTQAAADALEIREHYERTSPRLPAEVRFYEAYIRQEREFFESFNDAMRQYSAGLKDSLHGLFHDFAHTAGLTAQITEHFGRLSAPVPVIDFRLPPIDTSSWASAFDISQSIAELVAPLAEGPMTLVQEIGEMLAGLGDAVARMSADLAAATIAAQESSLLGLFDDLAALVRPHIDAADAFKAAGWPIAPSMPSQLIGRVVTMHRQGKTQYIGRTIIGFYQRNGHQNLRGTVASWATHRLLAPRMHILADALDAHCQGLYTLSVPAVIPQIEGVLNDYVRTNGLVAKLGKIGQVYRAAIGDVDEYPLSQWAIASTLLHQLQKNTYVPTDFRAELEKSLNTRRVTRHTVLHGVAPRYDRPIHSLKAFLLLDAVSALQDVED